MTDEQFERLRVLVAQLRHEAGLIRQGGIPLSAQRREEEADAITALLDAAEPQLDLSDPTRCTSCGKRTTRLIDAERLADAVEAAVRRGIPRGGIDSRSEMADALLDYRRPGDGPCVPRDLFGPAPTVEEVRRGLTRWMCRVDGGPAAVIEAWVASDGRVVLQACEEHGVTYETPPDNLRAYLVDDDGRAVPRVVPRPHVE